MHAARQTPLALSLSKGDRRSTRYSRVLLRGLALLAALVVACSDDDQPYPPPEFDSGMSVADALKASADETLLVNGWLTDRPGETRLCTTLEQGPYLSPPECGEPSVSVQLTLSGTPSYSLLGLDWVEPRKRRIGGITWVNEPVQVYGDILRKAGREPELIPRSRP